MTTPESVADADVCVVGAGPVGLTLARALSEAGATVTVLGGGPSATASPPLPPGEVLPAPLDDALSVELDAPGWAPLHTSRARGVGGTALIWNTRLAEGVTAKYLPLDPLDLEARTGAPHPGWPFGFDELEPWLRRADAVCGIDSRVWDGGGSAGPLVRSVYAFGSRERFTVELPAWLARSEGVHLHPGLRVVGLDSSAPGRVDRLRWIDPEGRSGTARARRIVLAAGALENARILLMGAADGAPWADHPWLGRGFMEHPIDRSLELVTRSPELSPDPGFFGPHRAPGLDSPGLVTPGLGTPSAPARADAAHGWRMGRLAPDPARLRAEGLPSTGVRFTTQEGPAVLESGPGRSVARRLIPFAPARRLIGGGVRAGARLARRLHGTRYRLHVDLEQWPDPDNGVRLSAARDAAGVPRLALHWRWSGADEDRRQRLLALLAADLEDAGLGRVVRTPGVGVDPNAHHHAGTTRMHADPRQGVVDAELRVHGTDTLFVCGSSVFPSAGMANPTLTAVALALRLAHHLHPGAS